MKTGGCYTSVSFPFGRQDPTDPNAHAHFGDLSAQAKQAQEGRRVDLAEIGDRPNDRPKAPTIHQKLAKPFTKIATANLSVP